MRTRILVIGVLALGLLFLASGALADARITAPQNGQRVSMNGNNVRLTISHSVPETSRPVLFLRDPNYGWWPWVNAAKESGDSHQWIFRNVQFGSQNDAGSSFKLVVVVCTERELEEGLMVDNTLFNIEPGRSISNSRMKAFLRSRPSIAKSAQITVTRE